MNGDMLPQLFWVQYDAIIEGKPDPFPTWIACPQGFSPKQGACVHLTVHRMVSSGADGIHMLHDDDDTPLWAYTVMLNYSVFCTGAPYRSANTALLAAERDFAELTNYGWRVLSDDELIEVETVAGKPKPDKPFLKRIVEKYPWSATLPTSSESV